MTLELTQPLTEMSTRNISWGKGGRSVRLTTLPPSCSDCLEIREPQPHYVTFYSVHYCFITLLPHAVLVRSRLLNQQLFICTILLVCFIPYLSLLPMPSKSLNATHLYNRNWHTTLVACKQLGRQNAIRLCRRSCRKLTAILLKMTKPDGQFERTR